MHGGETRWEVVYSYEAYYGLLYVIYYTDDPVGMRRSPINYRIDAYRYTISRQNLQSIKSKQNVRNGENVTNYSECISTTIFLGTLKPK